MKNARGMTMIELLLAATILAMVMMATLSLYRSGVFAYTKYRERQEQTDQGEMVMSMLAEDLRTAKTIDFAEQNRLGLRRTAIGDDGSEHQELLVYEFQQAPSPRLIRRRDYEETVLRAEVSEMSFAKGSDNAAVIVTCRIANRPSLCCTLPVGGASALAKPYPLAEQNTP